MRIRNIATVRVHYGYWRIRVLLKRDDWLLGKKRVYWIYKVKELEVRRKMSKKRVGKGSSHRPQLALSRSVGRWILCVLVMIRSDRH